MRISCVGLTGILIQHVMGRVGDQPDSESGVAMLQVWSPNAVFPREQPSSDPSLVPLALANNARRRGRGEDKQTVEALAVECERHDHREHDRAMCSSRVFAMRKHQEKRCLFQCIHSGFHTEQNGRQKSSFDDRETAQDE